MKEKLLVEVDVTHCYGELVVHQDVRFGVRANEFLCIAGPSGCGKTTLLDLLCGLLRPTRGGVLVDGAPVDPKRHNISFVFQEPSTLPWATVRDNIAVGLKIKKRPSDELDRIVKEIIEVVGLGGYEHFYPHQISGGMKQRVAIARAFATDADLILMDEPFVSLDQPTRARMQQEVLDIWLHRKRTIIFVTHNLEEAVFLGDRVIVLSAKPAKIAGEIPIDLPRPRDPLDKSFIELRAQCGRLLNESHLSSATSSAASAVIRS